MGQKSFQWLRIFYTYFKIFVAIFGSILFHQIVFKTSKSCFLSWFMYYRLDLSWFQDVPKRLKMSVIYWISTFVFVNQNCIKSTIFSYDGPKNDDFWSNWAKMGLIYDFSWTNPGVLFKCIPGVKLPKYTLIQLPRPLIILCINSSSYRKIQNIS